MVKGEDMAKEGRRKGTGIIPVVVVVVVVVATANDDDDDDDDALLN